MFFCRSLLHWKWSGGDKNFIKVFPYLEKDGGSFFSETDQLLPYPDLVKGRGVSSECQCN